ncbi:hypothetical protein CUR178_04133 [Leishmania enriettii]|uniref:Uncharacterized protein n=1 Tax=Leishmania enriettii TaxID=5663 RepID=A0A836KIF7_LEIEN|nr:hypothetical protein CUR178_04133 [Leishmania enriettii]
MEQQHWRRFLTGKRPHGVSGGATADLRLRFTSTSSWSQPAPDLSAVSADTLDVLHIAALAIDCRS